MGQKGTMVKKAESLRGDAIRWLDKNLHGKTFSQRYGDARELLHKASAARSRLEYGFPKDMKLRGQIAKEREKLYTQYKDAVAELTSDVEDAITQMKKLRGAFLASESAGQRAEYDAQIKTLKKRLDDFREYAKWVPADLKRREYREADAAIAEALSPKSVPRKSVPSPEVKKEFREVTLEIKEFKAERDSAKSAAKKATLARQINKLRAKRDRLKSELEAPAALVAAAPKKEEEDHMDFTKFASNAERKKFEAAIDKAIEGQMVLAKKGSGMPGKKERKAASSAGTEIFERKQMRKEEKKEMLAALKEAREIDADIKARQKAKPPKSIAGLRKKWFNKWVEAIQLGADLGKAPTKVVKAMHDRGIPFEKA